MEGCRVEVLWCGQSEEEFAELPDRKTEEGESLAEKREQGLF